MTPTEVPAVVFLDFIPVGFFVYRCLNLKNFPEVIVETAPTA